MGSSARKKREKKRDFQKPKLKVGKARPKAANQTDTSFRSKAIVLNQQSLNVDAPSTTTQFTHHVSLLSSKTDTQRKDSLGYLTTFVSSRVVDSPLPVPTSILLTKLCPLILDGSGSVRGQLLRFLRSLPPADIQDHAHTILPYVRAGMTHLSADIRASAVGLLSWLLEIAGDEVVSCAGGWQKTFDCFVTTLGWHTRDRSTWSANKASLSKFAGDSKTMARSLQILAEFIRAGIGSSDETKREDETQRDGQIFPLWHTDQHMIPTKSNAYGYLNLFGAPRDDDNQMLDDQDDRIRIFNDCFRPTIEAGLENAKREGGEAGRAAALVAKAIKRAHRIE